MATITIERVTKIYPNGFKAVSELDLAVADGEFMVLVGPSGCGKTTALRMVAGLEEISQGTVRIGERIVNHVASRDRDIAMVFQNYALYPHMTVRENIGYALKLRHVPKAEIRRKVDDAAAILGLTEWIERKPAQLSGGQRQRVAMGRAIVREPSAFLMDEPLSNLDAKLRVEMRAEVALIQRRLGVATVYVTHDQVEAMTMGDRVAVLRGGVLQQCDRPQFLYDNPANLFVAAFIGSPAMNLIEATLGEGAASMRVGAQQIELGSEVHAARPALRRYANQPIAVGVRPEDLAIAAEPGTPSGHTAQIEGSVELVEALGSELLVHFAVAAATRVEAEGVEEADAQGLRAGTLARRGRLVARVPPRVAVTAGGSTCFRFDPRRLHFFDPASELAIVG
jgi:multiple sugar transport system ATP-binding protein